MNVICAINSGKLRARLSARSADLTKALEKMRTMADRDQLTGLYNRRFILKALGKEKARGDRCDDDFSVCIIDLDGFRGINDRYGPAKGDEILNEFARYIVHQLRELDMLGASAENSSEGRFGGEEFILLLPGTQIDGAQICLERLRNGNKENMVGRHEDVELTFSAGLAEYIAGENVESLLRRADQALCAAKRGGRDQVVRANGLGA